tara:strand:- start:3501 stop:3620 length:120 start_codon:yes stop_codon:yes gene_type:complete
MLLFIINGHQVIAMSVQQALTKFKSLPVKEEKDLQIHLP